LLAVLALPIPWLHVVDGVTPGTVWRLDGRLEVDGRSIDPPGRWSWLVVGRPLFVAEAIWNAVVGTDNPPTNLRRGSVIHRPALAEPAAAAIGLRKAGRDVPLGLIVEAREPIKAGLPERALIVSIDGLPLTSRAAWDDVTKDWQSDELWTSDASGSDERRTLAFTIPDGRRFTAPGPGLPYMVVVTLDTAPADLEAGISFKLAQLLPVDWFRGLSLGDSHGLMVALVTYADASGHDLAQGRHIAGTGGIRADGSVTRIGGLVAKAKAAQRAGADVLLYPASQQEELKGKDLGEIELVPVATLTEAVEWLAQPVVATGLQGTRPSGAAYRALRPQRGVAAWSAGSIPREYA
jgi:hypothetical protein